MLIDANDVPGDVRADVCIVGGGAAGITLALELANAQLSVVVLESGDTEREESVEALAGGVTTGRSYPLATTRLRYLGGATNHWSGFCRPLDPIDFEPRPWIPYSGWPFSRAELDPYYGRAQTVCGLGPFEYDVDWWQERVGLETLPDDGVLATALYQVSPPVRFGEEYRPALTAAANVDVYLHADVVGLDLAPDGEAVSRARVATLAGNSWSASARVFVLAAGAIEVARLLLTSRDQQPEGIGNANDLIGRFFMEHPHMPRA
ncbi:MAG: FAD-dependent oxidoreductase, partial [Acidimicrobiia bacterium]